MLCHQSHTYIFVNFPMSKASHRILSSSYQSLLQNQIPTVTRILVSHHHSIPQNKQNNPNCKNNSSMNDILITTKISKLAPQTFPNHILSVLQKLTSFHPTNHIPPKQFKGPTIIQTNKFPFLTLSCLSPHTSQSPTIAPTHLFTSNYLGVNYHFCQLPIMHHVQVWRLVTLSQYSPKISSAPAIQHPK